MPVAACHHLARGLCGYGVRRVLQRILCRAPGCPSASSRGGSSGRGISDRHPKLLRKLCNARTRELLYSSFFRESACQRYSGRNRYFHGAFHRDTNAGTARLNQQNSTRAQLERRVRRTRHYASAAGGNNSRNLNFCILVLDIGHSVKKTTLVGIL
jgi:hypothetical protein